MPVLSIMTFLGVGGNLAIPCDQEELFTLAMTHYKFVAW